MKKLLHRNKEYYCDDIISYSFQEPSEEWAIWLLLAGGAKVKLECKDKVEWKILLCKLSKIID